MFLAILGLKEKIIQMRILSRKFNQFARSTTDFFISSSKFVARKSMDLRRIRSVKDRIEAICSSPMVDARPRRRYSFAEGMKNPREGDSSPLRLPNPKDLLHRTCRRLSRLILSRSNMLLSPRNELLGVGQSNITVESRSPKVLDDIPLENVNAATPFS